jgi:hypothetical protein
MQSETACFALQALCSTVFNHAEGNGSSTVGGRFWDKGSFLEKAATLSTA